MSRLPIALALFALLLIYAVPASAAGYLVQVFATQDPAAAKIETDRLMDQGIPSFSRAENVPDKGLWQRVYVGPFETQAEANAAAQGLKEGGLVKDFVVKADQVQSAPAPAAAAAPTADEIMAAPAADEIIFPPAIGENVQNIPAPPVAPAPIAQPAAPPVAPAPIAQPASPPVVPAAPSETPIVTYEGDVPVVVMSPGGGAAAPAAPLPVAETPTYGEPIAPAPASAAPAAPTYSQVQEGKYVPAQPTGPMKIQGFTFLVDLSSSMRNMAPCSGRIKEEAVSSLLRKMTQRIPSHPYMSSLRVFGYKKSWTRKDYTTTYFGPATFDRDQMNLAINRLIAADSISPFGWALEASDAELSQMKSPRAVLMFADFEVSSDAGAPVDRIKTALRRYGGAEGIKVYTFYVTRQSAGAKLAKAMAAAGGGQAYDVCAMLDDAQAFEDMMTEIFGPSDEPACPDEDQDGVCDQFDKCPGTPKGAPVDERGCWIAAYSQFFDFDKAVVKSSFRARLQHAAGIITANSQLPKITIAGHTDSVGADQYNLELGRKRAEAVKALLVEYGVPADRLAVESYGKTRPIADNGTEEGRAKNRRVEFHVGDVPKE